MWYAICHPMSTRKKHKNTPRPPKKAGNGRYWIAGTHACSAAIDNAEREISRILVTRNARERLPGELYGHAEVVEPDMIGRTVGPDVAHQGMAMEVAPLEPFALQDVLSAEHKQPILVLDQVTDPHNVGAMFRSAAAFGVAAIVTPHDNSAPENAALAKSACGGLDLVPWVRVTNLSQALEEMKQAGYWIAGMDGTAEKTVGQARLGKDTVLVMGAEGKGMRRLTQESCDLLVRLEMHPQMESLNVSNAAAIALHALFTNSK